MDESDLFARSHLKVSNYLSSKDYLPKSISFKYFIARVVRLLEFL